MRAADAGSAAGAFIYMGSVGSGEAYAPCDGTRALWPPSPFPTRAPAFVPRACVGASFSCVCACRASVAGGRRAAGKGSRPQDESGKAAGREARAEEGPRTGAREGRGSGVPLRHLDVLLLAFPSSARRRLSFATAPAPPPPFPPSAVPLFRKTGARLRSVRVGLSASVGSYPRASRTTEQRGCWGAESPVLRGFSRVCVCSGGVPLVPLVGPFSEHALLPLPGVVRRPVPEQPEQPTAPVRRGLRDPLSDSPRPARPPDLRKADPGEGWSVSAN